MDDLVRELLDTNRMLRLGMQAIREGHYTGHVPSGPDYVAYLQEAGFADAKYDWLLANRLGQIEARKPV